MKKKINPKVINMIEGYVSPDFRDCIIYRCRFSVVTREESLKKMLNQVQKDKKKIEETVDELDRYKRDALQKTWEKVDG